MQITPITSPDLARERQRTRSRILPHLHRIQTEAPVWTTSPPAFLQDGTLQNRTIPPPPVKPKSGSCPSHKTVALTPKRRSAAGFFSLAAAATSIRVGGAVPASREGRAGRGGGGCRPGACD